MRILNSIFFGMDTKDTLIEQLNNTIKKLKEEVLLWKEEYSKVNERLSKYTAPIRNKEYYHRTCEKIKNDPEYKEQRKMINKRAYEKRKQKAQEMKNQIPHPSIYVVPQF